jgi:hypothetical protein
LGKGPVALRTASCAKRSGGGEYRSLSVNCGAVGCFYRVKVKPLRSAPGQARPPRFRWK